MRIMRHWRAVFMAGVLGFTLLFVVRTLWLDSEDRPLPRLVFRFDVQSSTDSQALIIFNVDQGGRFVIPRSDTFQTLSLVVPETLSLPWGIRIEPLSTQGQMVFRNLAVHEETGRLAWTVDPVRNVESLNPQTAISVVQGEIRMSVAGPAERAILLLKGIFPLRTAADNLPRVTPLRFALAWGVLGGVTVVLLLRLVQAAARGVAPVYMWVAGVFVTVLGARLMTVMFMAVDFTYWDPWEGEAWNLYLPYMDGNLSWKMMFSRQNEHRVFFSRVLSLGQFLINGQWDNRFHCVLTAAQFSAVAAGLWMMLNRVVRGRPLAITALVLSVAALPFTWENIVLGFQSQFYFFVGFSLLTLWFLVVSPVFSAGWWFGAFCALCSLFTVGAGVVPSVAVAAIVVLRLAKQRRGWLAALATLGVCGGVGSMYALSAIQQHDAGMLTKNWSQGMEAFGRTLSWPFGGTTWMCLCLWLPVVAWAGRRLCGKQDMSREGWFLLSLAGWGALNALGMAVYRGGFGGGIGSRYGDIGGMFVVANSMAVLLLVEEFKSHARLSRWTAILGAGWAAIVFMGLISITARELWTNGVDRVSRQSIHRENMIRFLADDDIGRLLTQREFQMPYPGATFLAACLRNERVRAFLPASIRSPIRLVPSVCAGFQPNGIHPRALFNLYESVWGSFGPRGNLDYGLFESAPLSAVSFPYLEFDVQGDGYIKGGGRAKYLHLKDPATNRETGPMFERSMPGGWSRVTIPAPCKNPVVVAGDNDPLWWLGFKEPREKSRCSVWSDAFIDWSPWILGTGLLLLVLAVGRHRCVSAAG